MEVEEGVDGAADTARASPAPPPPDPPTELTDSELLELAAHDEAMLLSEREQQELAKVRRLCAALEYKAGLSPMASAERHAFKLVD